MVRVLQHQEQLRERALLEGYVIEEVGKWRGRLAYHEEAPASSKRWLVSYLVVLVNVNWKVEKRRSCFDLGNVTCFNLQFVS